MSDGRTAHRIVAVVTGSRADFGLLLPVIRALRRTPALRTLVIGTGAHLLPPARTIEEVRREVGEIEAIVEMQRDGDSGRLADAAALGRGIEGLARVLGAVKPHWALTLGDRIEALAASSAGSVGGVAVAHIHGGDRAEGIADEAMRHAVTKLAHLHLPATGASAQRIVRMGEDPGRVIVVGSPAIDGLDEIAPMTDAEAGALGDPGVVMLLHPSGLSDEAERRAARNMTEAVASALSGAGALALAPNHDPGRESIAAEIADASRRRGWTTLDHLPRPRFLALLKRLARIDGGALVGNSSAGLIECAALGLPVVNIGTRQAGRERPANVIDARDDRVEEILRALDRARALDRSAPSHPYGDGHAGTRIAHALASIDPLDPALLRKRCWY